jgi:hypothetical protein
MKSEMLHLMKETTLKRGVKKLYPQDTGFNKMVFLSNGITQVHSLVYPADQHFSLDNTRISMG